MRWSTPPVATEDPGPASRARALVLRFDPRLGATRKTGAQFVRFCVVGGTSYLANLIAFTVLVDDAQVPALAAACLAYAVGWVVAFAGHRWWTFRRREVLWAPQGLRYLAVSAVVLGIELGILHVLIGLGVEAVPAQALALACIIPASFLLNRGWAFR
jgi:putative flippase GtrA